MKTQYEPMLLYIINLLHSAASGNVRGSEYVRYLEKISVVLKWELQCALYTLHEKG